MTFRPGRIPFALMALLALSVATFGSGTVAAGAPVRVALAAAAVKASPSKLTFDAIGADHVKPFVLSTSASGLKASVIDPTICSVAPSAVPTDPNTRTFVVTPLAPGTTTITVLDASGATIATVPVTVVLAGATPVVSAPPNNTGLFAGIGAAAIGLVVLLSHGGSSTSSVSAPTTPPVVTPTPVEVTPTPVGVTATPTAVGATPTPTAIGATATPTPTPLPTQTPIPATPTPGPLKVNPTTFSFVVGEAPTTGTFTAAEVGYTGQFTVTSGNTADATVSPASGTGPSANFTITAVGPGTTLVTVKDAMGNEATVTVTVTQTNVVVNRRSARNAPGRNPQRRSP